jgi:DNA-binding HxlR family transcriptional regulator
MIPATLRQPTKNSRFAEPICAFPGLRIRPIEDTLRMVRKKWAAILLIRVYCGKNRFTDMMESVPGISTRMLALRLTEMEKSGLIRRTEDPSRARTPKYDITSKGSDLVALLASAGKFSMRHRDD